MNNSLIYCACGCGKKITKFDVRGRERKYVIGHFFKGKKFSNNHVKKIKIARAKRVFTKETRNKFRKNMIGKKYTLGYKHTKETKKKISEASLGNTNTLGYKHSKEAKEKIRKAMTGRFISEKTREKCRLNRLHQVFPVKDSLPERLVQNILIKNEVIFEKHKSILGQPDLFIKPNICIFVDGCYWHSCKQCLDQNKFTQKQREKIVKDELITQTLKNKGYNVLRFWEHEIKKDIDYIYYKIEKELKNNDKKLIKEVVTI